MGRAGKSGFAWMNGRFIGLNEANVPLLTHSLHYGSAVFEGIRFYSAEKGTALLRLDEHLQRLLKGASIAGINVPYSKSQLAGAIKRLIRMNCLKEGYIRLLAYYGQGAMQVIPHRLESNVAAAAWPLKSYLDAELARISISKYRRISRSSTEMSVKLSGNYTNSLLAGLEARKKGFHEALLLDENGNVAEGSAENIFFARGGELFTPKPENILPGITRDSIIRISRDIGIRVNEADIKPHEFGTFEESFFCGTAAEISPVVQIDDIKFGNSAGRLTKRLKQEFTGAVRGKNKKYSKWLDYI